MLGSVVPAVRASARVWAIGPHGGFVGAHDHGVERVKPTVQTLQQNIERALLSPFVEIVGLTPGVYARGVGNVGEPSAPRPHFRSRPSDGAGPK